MTANRSGKWTEGQAGLWALCWAFLLVSLGAAQPQKADPDPNRFAKEIAAFTAWDAKNSVPDNPLLFVGSSSIRLWNTAERFPSKPVINRGFGGAHISDVNYYIEETVLKHRPAMVVFYAGDNDIHFGKTARQVLEDYQSFVNRVLNARPSTHMIFISIKPSPARWALWPEMASANELIKSYSATRRNLHFADVATPMLGQTGQPMPQLFVKDGLHLNEKGYDIWTGEVSGLLRRVSSIRPSR